jgi:hypothetical protein
LPIVFAVGVLFEILRMALADVVRRLRGTYRSGYSLVGPDVSVGDVLAPDSRVTIASSPLYLGPGAGAYPVALVADAIGIRSDPTVAGLSWSATTARVIAILPAWTALGPNGELAIGVLHSAAMAPVERIRAAQPPSVSDFRLVGGDGRRRWLLRSLAGLAGWVVEERLRQDLLDNPPAEDQTEEELTQLFEDNRKAWAATRRLSMVAAFSAALIGDLPPRTVEAWSRPWVDLTLARESTRPSTSFRGRAIAIVRQVLESLRDVFVTLAVGLGLLYLMILNPYVGVTVLIATLIAALVVVRRRGTSWRNWRPDTQNLARPIPLSRVRQAMRSLNRSRSPLYQRWLLNLLGSSRIWVAVDDVRHADQVRWLSWLDQTGQAIPLRLFEEPGGRRVALAFTSPTGHRSLERNLNLHWTLELDWRRVVELSSVAGASAVVLDPGKRWSVETTPVGDGA